MDQAGFMNRVRSLYNIDRHWLPELSASEWRAFSADPPRFLVVAADDAQAAAIWREVERRQTPR